MKKEYHKVKKTFVTNENLVGSYSLYGFFPQINYVLHETIIKIMIKCWEYSNNELAGVRKVQLKQFDKSLYE